MAQAWKVPRGVQGKSLEYREGYIETLAEYYAEKRETIKQVELKKMHILSTLKEQLLKKVELKGTS